MHAGGRAHVMRSAGVIKTPDAQNLRIRRQHLHVRADYYDVTLVIADLRAAFGVLL